MLEQFINEFSKVITSRGRFGKVISTDGKKSMVEIGKETYQIRNKELLLVDNAKSIELEYYLGRFDAFKEPCKEIIYIDKRITIYDFNRPLENPLLDACKLRLEKRINRMDAIITKINLV